jgi:hypothetical protein
MATPSVIVKQLKRAKLHARAAEFEPADERLVSREAPVELLQTQGITLPLLRLNHSTCDRLLGDCINIVASKKFHTRIDRLFAPNSRFDIQLPPRGYCWTVLQRILANWKRDKRSPWHVFKVPGIEPALVEFALLGSLPGANAQTWHVDHSKGRGKLISFGIPLIDVQNEHGPLNCIPYGLNDAYYSKHPFKVRARRGEMFAWDGAMRHRGGKNVSSVARPLFMFSLCFVEKIPNGNDQSLHPDLLERLHNRL